MLTEHSPLIAAGAQAGLASSTPRLANGTSTQAPPRSSRLLHEPRGLLAKGCAYCTNPRTPGTTPNPPPVTPDLRALRPGDSGRPLGDRSRAQVDPRKRFSHRGVAQLVVDHLDRGLTYTEIA